MACQIAAEYCIDTYHRIDISPPMYAHTHTALSIVRIHIRDVTALLRSIRGIQHHYMQSSIIFYAILSSFLASLEIVQPY